MLYQTRTPAWPLRPYVEYLWYMSDAPSHAKERILSGGTFELVINLNEDEFRIYDSAAPGLCRHYPGAMVSGPYRSSFDIDTREHASIIGVHFRPGGALPFLGVPAHELADAHVDLGALWGHRARGLRERLCSAPSEAERFIILERALIDQFSDRVRRRDAVQAAVAYLDQSGTTVGSLARHVNLSHRRLIEVFTAEVGMTPKLFSRVRRFQRAQTLALRIPSPNWARLAVVCGYSDQSHLIREFIEFSGFSPRDLHAQKGVAVKEFHVALVEA